MRASFLRSAGLPRLALIGVALLLTRCGGGGGSPPPAAPVFFVTSAQPADGATEVDPSVDIVLTLSEAVDLSTVGPEAVRVGVLGEGSPLGLVQVKPGTGDTVLLLAPLAPLSPGKQYAILVSTFLRSATGHAIGGTLQFVFRSRNGGGGGGGGVVTPPASRLAGTTERMRQGRRSHTATLLDDGRVLLAGGYIAGTTVTNKGEVFSTAGQSFTLLSNRMASPRASHAAAKLRDGRVLLCGGYYEVSSGTLVSSSSAEIFDPSAGTFVAVGSMTTQRVDHAATLLSNGKVLVTGGSRLVGTFLEDLATAELFDPSTGTFSAAPAGLVHTHATHAVVDLADGRFLVVGGSDTDLRPELYSELTGAFTAIAPASSDIGRFGAAVARHFDGVVTVVGGEAQGQVLNFLPSTSTLTNSGSPTTMPRAYATVSPIGSGRMLVCGGIDYTNLNYVEPSCDLIVEGGLSGSATYPTAVRFPTGMAFHTATVLFDGRVLFCGGINSNAGQPEFDGAYLFTP
jgi:hypothetical protein